MNPDTPYHPVPCRSDLVLDFSLIPYPSVCFIVLSDNKNEYSFLKLVTETKSAGAYIKKSGQCA